MSGGMCVCVCHLDSYTITQNHTERKAFRVNKSEHTAKDKKSHTVIGNTDKARQRETGRLTQAETH